MSLAEIRRLALPTIGLLVMGGLAGWLGRGAVMAWLLNHSGDTPIMRASSPEALARLWLLLSFCFGVVLALPLIWWQACSLLTAATLERARPRFSTYLVVSFAVLLANPVLMVVQQTPPGVVDLSERLRSVMVSTSTEPLQFHRFLPVDDYVLAVAVVFLASAGAASLLTPLFLLTRFHSQSVHERYVTILSGLGAGSVLLTGQFLAAGSLPVHWPPFFSNALVVSGIVTAPASLPIVLWWRRRTSERYTWLTLVALTLGATVLLLGQGWLLILSDMLWAYAIAIYGICAALGLHLRRRAGQVTAH